MLILCPGCGRQVSDRALSCPGCGMPPGAAASPVSDLRHSAAPGPGPRQRAVPPIPTKTKIGYLLLLLRFINLFISMMLGGSLPMIPGTAGWTSGVVCPLHTAGLGADGSSSARMPWTELADLCARMTELRTEIRLARGIKGPMIRCSCDEVVDGGSGRRVSMRSALFALRNEGVLTEFRLKRLDAKWKKHRKAKGLDAYGRPAEADPNQASRRRMQA